ncbi:MAG TPA: PA domain-containing protein [Thermoanaerobaculia bacterium]|nr:PA domain-containing protein [Thermoanaerobaculia bacterium]
MRTRSIAAAALAAGLFGACASPLLASAKITVLNTDGPGAGFNDATPATPVGGNSGTTVGEQRLIAFQAAADIWGSLLDSSVEIRIQASFTPLTCDATSATLGSAGPMQVVSDFAGAPFPNTWYVSALGNKIAEKDLLPGDPKTNADDIRARFNSNLGASNCLAGTGWYYGLDGNHGNAIDLVTVLLHEFGHGLGFLTLVDLPSGNEQQGRPDAFERNIVDTASGRLWSSMSISERADSALDVRRVAWNGGHVFAAARSTLARGTPLMTVNAPGGIAGTYPVGTASFGAGLTSQAITGQVVAATDAADASGASTTDACSPLTNAAAVAGNIALVDRGTCTFVIKVKNCQNAGAIAVLIADNTTDSPPAGLGGTDASITIPAVRITMADGATLRSNLGSGVNATLRSDPGVLSGAEASGRPLLYSTNPVQLGSSISHWDTIASPSLLMEPNINPDLKHEVDLTLPLLWDIGWLSSDIDADGVLDAQDNCPNVFNPDQRDANGNGVGDACERSVTKAPRRGPPRTEKTR